METLKTFVEKVQGDESLQKEMAALSEKKDQDAINAFMKEQGVSEEDIRLLAAQQQAMTTGGELSDEMLEMVAGGGCWSKVPNIGNSGSTCVFFFEPGGGAACPLCYSFY
ncbi:MAG: Nif11-like leader peptide family RiPP precursor [Pseudomonadota bacterium]